jgi:hypothetical protein
VGGAGGGAGGSGGGGAPDAGPPKDGGGVVVPPPAGPPDPQEVKFCNDLAKITCDKLTTCLPFVLKATYGDSKTCLEREGLLCATSVAVPGSTINAAAEGGCAAALTAQTCDDYYNGTPTAACDFKGAGAAGGPCVSGRQCQTGNCVAIAGQTCGACAAYLPSGAPCNRSASCTPGLQCVTSPSGTGLCTALAKAGGPCAADDNCSFGLLCAAGKCVAALAVNAACNAMDDLCGAEQGLFCDPTSSKCVAAKTPNAGEVCDRTTQCTASAACAAMAPMATTGTCVAPPKEGAMCNQTLGCLPPAGCARDGQCHLPVPLSCN